MLEDKRLGLEFGSFLDGALSSPVHSTESDCVNLGEGKKALGDGNDILHLLNRVDSVLDSLSVFSASTVEDSPDFGNLGFSPVTVRLADRLEYNSHVSTITKVQ